MKSKNQVQILDLRKKLENTQDIPEKIESEVIFAEPQVLEKTQTHEISAKPILLKPALENSDEPKLVANLAENLDISPSSKKSAKQIQQEVASKKVIIQSRGKKSRPATLYLFNILFSVIALFVTTVFVGSSIVGAIQLKTWLPKLFLATQDKNHKYDLVFIPEFLLKKIDESKDDPNVFKFQTEHTIIRYENIDKSVQTGLGAVPTITLEDFKSQIGKLKTSDLNYIEPYDFLQKLYAKEKQEKSYSLIFVGGYSGQYDAFKFLKSNNLKATFFIPAAKVGKPGFLTWEQIKEISDNGFTVGATGFEYLRLGSLDVSEQISQIKDSKKIITQNTNKEVLLFYYPFGSYDANTLGIVRNNSFIGAVGNGEGSTQDLEKSLELQSVYNGSYFG